MARRNGDKGLKVPADGAARQCHPQATALDSLVTACGSLSECVLPDGSSCGVRQKCSVVEQKNPSHPRTTIPQSITSNDNANADTNSADKTRGHGKRDGQNNNSSNDRSVQQCYHSNNAGRRNAKSHSGSRDSQSRNFLFNDNRGRPNHSRVCQDRSGEVPRKSQHNKKKESKAWQSESSLLERQLANEGKKMCKIKEDGNCLFRAIAHQLFNDSEKYAEVRGRLVEYLRNNAAKYESYFVDKAEQRISCDEYCNNMAMNEKWGGHLEILAAMQVYKVNVRHY